MPHPFVDVSASKVACLWALVTLAACHAEGAAEAPRTVTRVLGPLAPALLSVAGEDDGTLWLAGADAGDGRGAFLARRAPGRDEVERVDLRAVDVAGGALWWVHVVAPGRVLVAGDRGRVLAVDAQTPGGDLITRLDTRTGVQLYGVAARDGLAFAVGGAPATVLAIDLASGRVEPVALPADVPASARLFKVFAAPDGTFEVVGEAGIHLSVTPSDPPRVTSHPVPGGPRLVTIHGPATPGSSRLAVGGTVDAYAVEIRDDLTFRRISPPSGALLNGVFVGARTFAVGFLGAVFEREGDAWRSIDGVDAGFDAHAVYVDASGTAWIAGGRLLDGSLRGGALWRLGPDPHALLTPTELDVAGDVEVTGDVAPGDVAPEVSERCTGLAPATTLELGERDARGCFQAFVAGGAVRVVNGPQGGSHVELAVRFPATSANPRIRIEATLVVEDSVVARFSTRDLPAELDLVSTETRVTTDVPIIFASADPTPWLGRTARLTCLVEAGDAILTGELEVTITR